MRGARGPGNLLRASERSRDLDAQLEVTTEARDHTPIPAAARERLGWGYEAGSAWGRVAGRWRLQSGLRSGAPGVRRRTLGSCALRVSRDPEVLSNLTRVPKLGRADERAEPRPESKVSERSALGPPYRRRLRPRSGPESLRSPFPSEV